MLRMSLRKLRFNLCFDTRKIPLDWLISLNNQINRPLLVTGHLNTSAQKIITLSYTSRMRGASPWSALLRVTLQGCISKYLYLYHSINIAFLLSFSVKASKEHRWCSCIHHVTSSKVLWWTTCILFFWVWFLLCSTSGCRKKTRTNHILSETR